MNQNIMTLAGIDLYPKAPSYACLQHFERYITSNHENHEMLLEQMEALLEKNAQEIKNIPAQRGMGMSEAVVNMIFAFSNRLRTPDSVKYLACEVHDRLMINMSTEFTTNTVENNRLQRKSKVRTVEPRFEKQQIHRIGSCVQLAIKSCSFGYPQRRLNILNVQDALRDFCCHQSTQEILQYELRVWELLNFNVNFVTAFDIVELLLFQLRLHHDDYRKVYTTAIYSLDHIYLKREEIYLEYYELCNARTLNQQFDREIFRQIKFDKFIEGSATLASAFFVLHMERHPSFQSFEQIVMARINVNLVYDLSAVVIRFIEKKNTQVLNSGTKRFRGESSSSSSKPSTS